MTTHIPIRRKVLAVLAAATLLAVSTGVMTVLAVHDEDFQLEGDALAATTTSFGGTQSVDWDSLFDANGAEKTLPTDFTASGFKRDFNSTAGGGFLTNDTTTFATGSKDTLPIAGWQCNFDNNVNSKIDVMNAYAAAYTDPGSGDQIIYFALERNTNTGDANVGFWFLQDSVGCETTGGAATFSGAHHDGDILIVSAFTKGGDVSTIDVYRWNGDDATGSLGTTPVAHGVDCRSDTLPTGDPACAAANTIGNGTGGTITVPWLTANFKDGVGHSLRTGEFFEGAVNLTDTDLGGRCFNTFIGDTRSSQSLTATLFDYAAGSIGECTAEVVTTPKQADGSTDLTTIEIPVDGTVEVKDEAVITVTGASSFDATVSFSLCGPFAADSTTLCDDSGGNTAGVPIGSAQAVTSSPATITSDAATITSAGRYCWRAEFSGDLDVGVPAAEDARSSECFIVTPVQPTLVTQATIGPVEFGSSISDVATLAGTANQPGSDGPTGSVDGSIDPTTAGGEADGSISLTVYGPDSCTTVAYGPVSIDVSGDGDYGGDGTDFEFTPAAPGQYVFVASYDGDGPNTLGVAATACADQPAEEKVTVEQIPTTIATAQKVYPQDSSTVASTVAGNNLPAGGTVTFRLYSSLASCQAHGTTVGAGGLLYAEAKTIQSAANSVTLGTSNTTVAVDADGTYYWWVTYATGDSAHTGSQSNCAESTALDFTNDTGPGTLFP